MSSRRALLGPLRAIAAGDMSQASITSKALDVRYIDNIGIQAIWTGAPTGTVKVQASHDAKVDGSGAIAGGTWTDIAGATAAPAGGAGSALIALAALAHPFIRIVYTRTGGAGSLDVHFVGKGA